MSASANIKKKDIFDKNILERLNFNIYKIDGHNYKKILNSLNSTQKNDKSSIIIADTIKGKGFKIFENNKKYSHGLPAMHILERIINEKC
jgi:deoxyxylulose-5-phosphate synthase